MNIIELFKKEEGLIAIKMNLINLLALIGFGYKMKIYQD
jgi:hypothetical protein